MLYILPESSTAVLFKTAHSYPIARFGGMRSPKTASCFCAALLQLRVLGFGFFQDGDVGVGVFPEREEIFVGGERPDAGRIGIRSL